MSVQDLVATHLRRALASLSLPDWGVVGATLLLDLSLLLPWVSVAGFVLRPADLLGAWALVGLLALIVLATVVAGRWPYTRWMALVPLVCGCLLLGVLAGVGGAVLALNPLLAQVPWQEANEVAQTATRVAGVLRLSIDQLDRLSAVAGRFAGEPQLSLQPGSGLFGASAVALIVVGYRKIVERFAPAGALPPRETPALGAGQGPAA
jgi:hypothetical protein